MKKKKCGYYYRINKQIKELAMGQQIRGVDFRKLSPARRRWAIAYWFDFKWFVVLLFFVSFSYGFQGVGDCEKLLTDYAQLTNKSVFLPSMLSGKCVVQSEKHFPLIMKNAGLHYKESNGIISLKHIEPAPEKPKEEFKPRDLYYDVSFAFVNIGNAFDCGIKVDDVLATFRNISYDFTFGGSLGCPAMDYDGSFVFNVNAHLIESWSYSHGLESQRQNAQITSATGAVTNQYEWITTGLNLTLSQTEKGINYTLKYTGNNGSVSTSAGGLVEEVRATIIDEYTTTRKLLFVPIGSEKRRATYSLVLRIVPRNDKEAAQPTYIQNKR